MEMARDVDLGALRLRRRRAGLPATLRAGSVDDTTDAMRAVACIRFVRLGCVAAGSLIDVITLYPQLRAFTTKLPQLVLRCKSILVQRGSRSLDGY